MQRNIIHLQKSTQNKIKESLPNELVCEKLSYFYSLFSDGTRLKIIVSLLTNPMCVNDLSALLNINQTTISHQLKILKSVGAVNCNRKNKFIFYSIDNKFIKYTMLNGLDFLMQKRVG